MKQFNKKNLKKLRVEMNEILQTIAEKYNVKISVGNASYSDNEVTFKTKINTFNEEGIINTKEAENWEFIKGSLTGLSHLTVGDKVVLYGTDYILKGYNLKAKKYPVIIQSSNNKQQFNCAVKDLAQNYRNGNIIKGTDYNTLTLHDLHVTDVTKARKNEKSKNK